MQKRIRLKHAGLWVTKHPLPCGKKSKLSPLQLFNAIEHRKYHLHPFDTSGAPDTTVIYKSYFVLLDQSRPYARIASVTLLALGFVVFLLPSADVFFKVIRKLLFGG
jgi:hypothetical protein